MCADLQRVNQYNEFMGVLVCEATWRGFAFADFVGIRVAIDVFGLCVVQLPRDFVLLNGQKFGYPINLNGRASMTREIRA